MALLRRFRSSNTKFPTATDSPLDSKLELEDDLGQLVDTLSNWDISSVTGFTDASGTSSISLSRGIPLGSLSGKVIMAVGNFVVRGIEAVDMQVRLRRIATQLGQEVSSMSSAAVKDLLELQRVGLYPDNVRRRAMQLVILVMCRRRPYEQLVDALLQQPSGEIRLFFQQLCRLILPDRTLAQRTIVEVSTTDSDGQDKRETSLSDRFCKLFLAVIDKYPSVLLDDVDSLPLFEVILYLLRSGRAGGITYSNWDNIDLQQFVRELNRLRLSGWTYQVPPEAYPFLAACVHEESHDASPRKRAKDGFCNIISKILKIQPTTLNQSFTTKEMRGVLFLLLKRRRYRSVLRMVRISSQRTYRRTRKAPGWT